MQRIFILSFAIGLGVLAFADPADACHHRRKRRHGCGGGCGDGGYAPAYYDNKGGYKNYAPAPGGDIPAPPPPPPAPRPA